MPTRPTQTCELCQGERSSRCPHYIEVANALLMRQPGASTATFALCWHTSDVYSGTCFSVVIFSNIELSTVTGHKRYGLSQATLQKIPHHQTPRLIQVSSQRKCCAALIISTNGPHYSKHRIRQQPGQRGSISAPTCTRKFDGLALWDARVDYI